MSAQARAKRVIIIAGPNGAGKTTFARSFLPVEAHLPRFINADLIAAGLAPFAPETAAIKAGRLMLEEIEQCVQRGESFAFETTLSGWAICATSRSGGRWGTRSACIFCVCRIRKPPSLAWPSACVKAGMTFRRMSSAAALPRVWTISMNATSKR